MNEIWILGATGRSGRAVAARLAQTQFPLVLVGLDATRLQKVAASIGGDARIVVADSIDAMARAIASGKPAVVVNTVGPFAQTALPIVKACAPGTHYVDISNELASFIQLFARHDQAVAAGQTLVMGAGFGVLATESVVIKLCAGQLPASKVRVDVMPFVEVEAGTMGQALASTIVGGIVEGGRRYSGSQLVRTRPVSSVTTVAASSMVPNSPVMSAILPAITALMSFKFAEDFATRRLAAVEIKPGTNENKEPQFSWAHARVSWESGETREGWLQLGDAGEFTTKVFAEVALRLTRGECQPGVYTPGALFGPQLAEFAGGQFLL